MRAPLLWIAFVIAPLSACTGGEEGVVTMTDDFRFDPSTITVAIGDEITFTNTTTTPHSVTAYGDDLPRGADFFSSGNVQTEAEARADVAATLLDPKADFELTLHVPGTYRYFCLPHEKQGMRGTIIVER